MDIHTHIGFTGTEIASNEAETIRGAHEGIRREVEKHLRGAWRVTKMTEQATTTYDTTLATRTTPEPEYILAFITATFDVELVENAALDEIIDGEVVSRPLKRLHCKAQLLSNGHLKITGCTLVLPSREDKQ